ncbi:MAG: TetR/AcrR family transcriptional regulator [Gemmatimonadaceae bacterium]|nr:TetR/AcrR family transcriptional regulator [Chitinophagaceae bacterium]
MRTRNTDKEKIVREKAVELLLKEGFEGFSVNKLAKLCAISVATLYIYYKDKDDLILKVAIGELQKMNDMMLTDFDPELPFEEGLRIQWKNRARYLQDNPTSMLFMEKLRNSTYQEKVFENTMTGFKTAMSRFMQNAVKRGEINPMPVEVFWAIAYGPLYTLARFDNENKSLMGKPFTLSNKILWQTFDFVIKALKNKT